MQDDRFKIFRKNVQLLAIQKEVSMKDLSLALGWFEGRCGNIVIKNGHHKPTASELIELAKYFDVNLDELVLKGASIIFK